MGNMMILTPCDPRDLVFDVLHPVMQVIDIESKVILFYDHLAFKVMSFSMLSKSIVLVPFEGNVIISWYSGL
jgi:hypothetical protein